MAFAYISLLTITDSQPILLLDQDGAFRLGMRMRSYIIARVLLVLAGSSLLLGCGGGAMGTQQTVGSQQPATAEQLPNNANGADILDASGNAYYFDTHSQMHQAGTNTLLSNFWLNWSPPEPATYPLPGAEDSCGSIVICPGFVTPFEVILTNNPAGADCIAVLATYVNASTSPPPLSGWETEYFLPLSVNPASYGSASIAKTVTAYKTYWNGNIPICGGNSPYAGSYTSTDTSSAAFASGWTLSNGKCVAQSPITSRDTGAPYVNFTIDSGGAVDSESSHITGSMNTPVNQSSIIGAAVGSQTDASCIPVVNVTSMTQNSAGKWMLEGTENFAGQTTPFDATQN